MQTSKLKQRMPRWLRVSVVLMFLALSGVVGYVVYDYTTRPKTLSIAVGSVDGDAVRLLSTLSTRMAATNSPVQLRVVDAGTPLKAAEQFAKGEVDLAIARADIGDLSSARTVVTVANATMLILAPAGAGVSDMGSLRNKTVGVIGLDTNQKIIDALAREYDLAAHKTTFRPLLPGDAVDAFKQRRIQALKALQANRTTSSTGGTMKSVTRVRPLLVVRNVGFALHGSSRRALARTRDPARVRPARIKVTCLGRRGLTRGSHPARV